MRVEPVQNSLINYMIGHVMRANAQHIRAAVAVKTLNTARQAGESVLQLLDAAAQTVRPATETLTAKISGCGRHLDTYA